MPISWKLWQAELKTPTPEAERQDARMNFINEVGDDARLAMSGFWRIAGAKTKVDYPVAIWTLEGQEAVATIFQIGGQDRNTKDHADDWHAFVTGSWLKCMAVSRKDWDRAKETKFWPDGKVAHPSVSADEKLGISPPSGNAEVGGTNETAAETLDQQITSLIEKMKAHEVKDQASADAASGYLDKLRRLLDLAEQARVAEKEPFLEGGRSVDAKWKGIMEPGKDAGNALIERRKAWLKAEQKRLNDLAEAENRRLADEARILNAARRAEHERQVEQWQKNHAAWLAETPGETTARLMHSAETIHTANSWMGRKDVPVEEILGNLRDYDNELRSAAMAAKDAGEEAKVPAHIAAPPPDIVPEKVEAQQAQTSSAFGRATKAKAEMETRVTNPAALATFFLYGVGGEDNAMPDEAFLAYLLERAKKAVRAKVTLPGVETKNTDQWAEIDAAKTKGAQQ